MGIFNLGKSKPESFFTVAEKDAVLNAIRRAEKRTSGEVRVFIEMKCRFMDAVERAAEIFYNLKMDATQDRNAVLVYLALKDRQFAIFADEGIYKALGKEYWDKEAAGMVASFKKESYADGLVNVTDHIGQALHHHFPYDRAGDKNELPDDIVFGK